MEGVKVKEWDVKWDWSKTGVVKKNCQVVLEAASGQEFAWIVFYFSCRPISTRGRVLDWGEL